MVDHQEELLNKLSLLVQRDHQAQQSSSSPTTPVQNEVRPKDRDAAVTWLYEVCMEQSWPLHLFVHAAHIMDRFLAVCRIRQSQLQLLAVVCMTLAGKAEGEGGSAVDESTLVEYSDGAVKSKEVRAWEMLVLSKLSWNLRLVTPCDFLQPLSSLLHPSLAKDGHLSIDSSAAALLPNAELVSALSCRDASFTSAFPAGSRALAALLLAASCQSHQDALGGEIFSSVLGRLRLTTARVRGCLSRMETLLWTYLPHPSSDEKKETTKTTPPPVPSSSSNGDNQSPFKITSASTPKTSRDPLRENTSPFKSRRRLLSAKATSENEEEAGGDKENRNDDSAIGMMNTTAENQDGISPVSSKSAHSSKSNSPDSGASSTSSNPTAADLLEIDRMLSATNLKTLRE